MNSTSSLEPSAFQEIAAACAPYKAILSKSGWAYLINDTNDFFRVLFGLDRWTDEERFAAKKAIEQRVINLEQRSIHYIKFIVPEKPIVYPEYLPDEVTSFPFETLRPAQLLALDCPGAVHYLDAHFGYLKSISFLYFRCDTHPNWIGAWCVYKYIVDHLCAQSILRRDIVFNLKHLDRDLVAYSGDLVDHLSPDAGYRLRDSFHSLQPNNGVEWVTRLQIPATAMISHRVKTPDDYLEWYDTRETFVFEGNDASAPRAVFFRDSTLDRGAMELLAQHFSRSVFVWHLGLVDMDVIEREAPHIVVHVMAERFVSRYPDFPPFFKAKAHYIHNKASNI